MITYNEFLESVGIISGEKFNEVLNSFSGIEFDLSNIDPPYDLGSQTSIAEELINCVLRDKDDWWSYVDEVNFEDKTFYLEDVQSLKELKEIKEIFKLWTISNYYEIEEELLETEKEELEKEEKNKKFLLLNKLSNLLSLEELENIVNEYDKE